MNRNAPSRRSLPVSVATVRKAVFSQLYSKRWLLVALVSYMALAVWQTWPVILSPFSEIPIGSEPVASVPLYNVWTIWWNSDRLAAGLQGYWDAPIFFSTPGAFALAEPQPITMLLAPVIWVTG